MKFDNERLNILNTLIANRVDKLKEALDIDLWRTAKVYYGTCCVHGGNNDSALNIYPKGHTVPGCWRCNTRHCESFFKKTLIGFVRGALSHKHYDWTCPKDKYIFDFRKTIDWCCDFVGQKFNKLELKDEELEQANFIKSHKPTNSEHQIITDVKTLRSRLFFPAKHFIERGFSEQTLNNFHVGVCLNKEKPLNNRVVVPILDDTAQYVIGCTARSIYPQCNSCKLYHPTYLACDAIYSKGCFSKWKNSPEFNKEWSLYNLWNAVKYIEHSKRIILCEGPADVWKLEMAGIHDAVALLGSALTEGQQILLEKTPATKIVVLSDNDEAGNHLRTDIFNRLKGLYKLQFPEFPGKDIGELTVEQVKEIKV